MAKFHGFSIVLHDLHKGIQTKNDVANFIKSAKSPATEYVVAEEPYDHIDPRTGLLQDGSHIHVFIRYKSRLSFKSVLSQWCNLWSSGRVEVKVQRGSMASGCKYVVEGLSKKDKSFDPHPIIFLDMKAANAAGVVTQKERPQSDGSMGVCALHELIKSISTSCLQVTGTGCAQRPWWTP